eukprot:CAMPEP_0171345842 /NCGR_PEP_ID=MMETSP0878-20121228/22707_1 /TAXON_ID=67004 /ORGANISM="Thalassiosira weissflogii, Strain CCMP1336" /LENGTH=185 /DNA_ID=CAMNT_0011849361 /DNA_START=66 /DNA_END=620 /DNA_ORIENTATION=+
MRFRHRSDPRLSQIPLAPHLLHPTPRPLKRKHLVGVFPPPFALHPKHLLRRRLRTHHQLDPTFVHGIDEGDPPPRQIRLVKRQGRNVLDEDGVKSLSDGEIVGGALGSSAQIVKGEFGHVAFEGGVGYEELSVLDVDDGGFYGGVFGEFAEEGVEFLSGAVVLVVFLMIVAFALDEIGFVHSAVW